MIDRPVLGQIGRADDGETIKVEILGELKGKQWDKFIECIKDCADRWPTLTVKITKYKVRMRNSFPPKPRDVD